MPSHAPGKVTPLTKRTNKMAKGNVAVRYTTLPTDLTPFIMHRNTTTQDAMSQSSSSQTMVPGIWIPSDICSSL
jgi:hypothetical protein